MFQHIQNLLKNREHLCIVAKKNYWPDGGNVQFSKETGQPLALHMKPMNGPRIFLIRPVRMT